MLVFTGRIVAIGALTINSQLLRLAPLISLSGVFFSAEITCGILNCRYQNISCRRQNQGQIGKQLIPYLPFTNCL